MSKKKQSCSATQRRSRLLPLCFLLAMGFAGGVYAQADKILNTPITNAQAVTATHSITLNPGLSANGANGEVSFSIVAAPVQNCVPLVATPSSNQNYVMTLVPRQPFTDALALSSKNTCEVMQTIQYIDGLGRPLQTVQVKGNPDATRDVIAPVAYDQFGREATKYLPYTTSNGLPGAYRPNALADANGQYNQSEQYGFYHPLTAQNYTSIDFPSASTGFESSPLNRVTEQGAPGTDWQLGSGHTDRITYATNNATSLSDGDGYWVKRFDVTFLYTYNGNYIYQNSLTDLGSYDPNQLFVTITKNENWSASQQFLKLNTTEEYKDKLGKIILKRTFNVNSTVVPAVLEVLSTYYVYDVYNNLTYVLPPGANADNGLSSNSNQSVLDNLCFQYRYDGRNRLIEKKIPGKGWELTIYNSLDQVVLTQDANQRNKSPQQWTFTKYDALGRVLMTGIYADDLHSSQGTNSFRAAYQTITNGYGNLWEDRSNSATGYTMNAIPQGSILNYLSINYYDDYTFPTGNTSYPYILNSQIQDMPATQSGMTKGLLTASKVNVLGSNDMLWTVNYYDDKGRVIQTNAQHYLGGTLNAANYDEISNEYDFSNEVTKTIRRHFAGNATTPALKVADSYVYDHMGRKRQSWSTINSQAAILISQADYNEVGQLYQKHLHSTNSGSSFLQDITYNYNQRGWLTSQNSTKFTLNLAYNTGITTGATAQYNGNIAEMYTTSDHTAANSKMKYTYDPLNRLNAADDVNNGMLTENGISYDKMGNIGALTRTSASVAALTYSYSGNQLTTVLNNGSPFRSYSYDSNGNATTDGINKAISYNMLNLPQTVTQGSTTLSTYTYAASGTKVRNTSVTDGTWDYVGGIVYHNGAIAFVGTEEGRTIPNGGTSYSYQYNLKDHLGNNRVSMDNTGVLQEDEYYAFGLRNGKYDASNNNRYLYNGKEIQTDLISQYDYGARFYDPVIGRWTSVDPASEQMRRHSPYNYAFNNPIRFIDPDGNAPANEYTIVVQDGQVQSTTMTGTKGGNETDYVTVVNQDRAPYADGITTVAVKVKGEATSGPGSDEPGAQEKNPTPGFRTFHGTMPTDLVAYQTLGLGLLGRVFGLGRAAAGVEGATAIGADAVSIENSIVQTTLHGAERIAGAGATRGGVLTAEEVAATQTSTKVLTQADGAAVHIAEAAPGRFNVVVSGERGVITTFKNISEKSLTRLSKNYGWQ